MSSSDSPERPIADLAAVRRLGLDDFSTVRYVHASSFKTLAGPLITEAELESFTRQVYQPAYVDALMALNTFVAVLDGRVIATAAWGAGDDSGAVARIGSVFVDPVFTRCGLGRRLVREVEQRATEAGYRRFSVRATANAVPFFQALDYEIASHGVSSLTATEGTLQVTFMRKSAGPAKGRRAA
jgi:predicted N-acetyltransferase YhbS